MAVRRPLRVLLLVNQFPPDINASGRLMKALAVELTRRGHELHIVTTFPHYAGFRVQDAYRGRLIEHTTEDGLRVTRVWSFTSGKKHRMWHRLANYISYNKLAFLAAQSSSVEYDVILAPNGSFFTGVTAWLLGALRRIGFIYNVQDIYPDVPLRAGQLEWRWQVRGLARIERFMYARAAHITVISEAQRANLIGKGVPAARISIVPNFVDSARCQESAVMDSEYTRRWQSKFVLMHAGNIGFAYDFDTLLQTAALLLDVPHIHFVIMGDGVRRAELQARARARSLTNVEFLEFQPEEQFPSVRGAATVQLSLYRRGSSALSLPSKLYEIMASGAPLIASAEEDSDIAALLSRSGAGLRIDPEAADQLAGAVRQLHDDPALCARMADAGRAYVRGQHSLTKAADAYEALLESVAGEH